MSNYENPNKKAETPLSSGSFEDRLAMSRAKSVDGIKKPGELAAEKFIALSGALAKYSAESSADKKKAATEEIYTIVEELSERAKAAYLEKKGSDPKTPFLPEFILPDGEHLRVGHNEPRKEGGAQLVRRQRFLDKVTNLGEGKGSYVERLIIAPKDNEQPLLSTTFMEKEDKDNPGVIVAARWSAMIAPNPGALRDWRMVLDKYRGEIADRLQDVAAKKNAA